MDCCLRLLWFILELIWLDYSIPSMERFPPGADSEDRPRISASLAALIIAIALFAIVAVMIVITLAN